MFRLFAQEDCWKFQEEHPDEWASFGCGPGKLGDIFVPDSILGLSIKPACQIHDWDTRFAPEASEEHRLEIARVFKWNCMRIIFAHTRRTWLLISRIAIAQIYYAMVVNLGGPAYWEERNPDSQYKLIKMEVHK